MLLGRRLVLGNVAPMFFENQRRHVGAADAGAAAVKARIDAIGARAGASRAAASAPPRGGRASRRRSARSGSLARRIRRACARTAVAKSAATAAPVIAAPIIVFLFMDPFPVFLFGMLTMPPLRCPSLLCVPRILSDVYALVHMI